MQAFSKKRLKKNRPGDAREGVPDRGKNTANYILKD